MAEELQTWVLQSNQHWSRLLERIEKTPSIKTLRQIAFAFIERVIRKRPDELDYVCDTLNRIVEDFTHKSDLPFSESKSSSNDKIHIDSSVNRQHYTQACLTLGIFRDIALSVNTDARRDAGTKLLTKLLQVPTSRIVLHEIGKNQTQTNKDLIKVLNVSNSRVSQILNPLKDVGLIDFRREGTSKLYSLTELGFDEVKRVLGVDYRNDAETSNNFLSASPDSSENFAYAANEFINLMKSGMNDEEAVIALTEEVNHELTVDAVEEEKIYA